MTPAIEVETLAFELGGRSVLELDELRVGHGEVLAVAGPSGSGKTTLLRLIMGLVAPTRGVIRIDGIEVSSARGILVPPEERGLGVVFQDLALWPHLSVAGNLAFGLKARGVGRRERGKRIADMLSHVGLAARHDALPGELSGGEQQRVAIARALVLRPRALLLDEPLSNLDVGLKDELLELFRTLLSGQPTSTLLVTHDPQEASALGDRLALLEAGRLTQLGTLAELRKAPRTRFAEAFLRAIPPSSTERGSEPSG